MLAGLAERLCDAGHRLDEVLLPHIEPRRHLIRDFLGGLIGDRAGLASRRCTAALTRPDDSAGGFLDLVNDLPAEMVGSVTHRRFRIVWSTSWCCHHNPLEMSPCLDGSVRWRKSVTSRTV
jgi:hypothetical protein